MPALVVIIQFNSLLVVSRTPIHSFNNTRVTDGPVWVDGSETILLHSKADAEPSAHDVEWQALTKARRQSSAQSWSHRWRCRNTTH
ncbi:hypothetical protein C8F04DRAFT_1137737 [Mycena alexandri]|uniref:Uncharacterized protein n=1 Tax=Mycena alexandri TaxID=1745969 RepID=A0AAD6S7H6_9AGAR|nr:hypothetical protein C8F04DRAFT_1137737 [Mycena alexandri]